MRNQKRKPHHSFTNGIPPHSEQIMSGDYILHDTKGWRKKRSGNTVRGKQKIEAFISMAIRG